MGPRRGSITRDDSTGGCPCPESTAVIGPHRLAFARSVLPVLAFIDQAAPKP